MRGDAQRNTKAQSHEMVWYGAHTALLIQSRLRTTPPNDVLATHTETHRFGESGDSLSQINIWRAFAKNEFDGTAKIYTSSVTP